LVEFPLMDTENHARPSCIKENELTVCEYDLSPPLSSHKFDIKNKANIN